MTTLVLDNGASTIKAGLTTSDSNEPRLILNTVVRSKGDKSTYVGHEFEDCRDRASLHYRLPFEKGCVVDWDAQKAVWDGLLSSQVFGIDPSQTSLLVTEPYFNLPNVQDVYDQFIFEDYEFQSYLRCCPAALVPYGHMFDHSHLPAPECMIIVDAGFSYTHVVPVLNGSVIWEGVIRIDVGGKLLTNQLKELVSFRQWNMMEETYVMNEVKELCCYVTTDLKSDMETCRSHSAHNHIVQDYVLPDFATRRKGRVRVPEEDLSDSDQVLRMNNERFLVPEILFRPDDIGLPQVGIPEAITQSIARLPQKLQGMFWANVGVVGGSAKFPGFRERLLSELRSLAPIDYEVRLYIPTDPVSEVYKSALAFARSPMFEEVSVTRAEYLEHGSNICRRKFRGWNSDEQTNDKGRGKAAPARADTTDDSNSHSDSTTSSSTPARRPGRPARGRGSRRGRQ